jgi:hypothetical protein
MLELSLQEGRTEGDRRTKRDRMTKRQKGQKEIYYINMILL